MITCPKCKNTLPDWAQSCQFCHSDLKAVARPVTVKKEVSYYGQMAKWVWPCYYAISGYIVFIAVVLAALTLLAGPLDIMSKIGLTIDALILIVGLGLLVQNDFIRGIGMYFAAIAAVISVIQTAHIVTFNASVPAFNRQMANITNAIAPPAPSAGNKGGTASTAANQQNGMIQIQGMPGQQLTADQQAQLQQFQDQINKDLEQSLPPDKRKAFEQELKKSSSTQGSLLTPFQPVKPISPIILFLSAGNIFVFLFLMYLIYETEHNSY